MALPKSLWDRDALSASWAWGWRLKSRQRRDALKLADAGERHPDPHVATLVRRYVQTRPSSRAFTIEMVSALVFIVIAVTALKLWTSLSVAGGVAAGIVGIAFAIWQRQQASRLTRVYGAAESQ